MRRMNFFAFKCQCVVEDFGLELYDAKGHHLSQAIHFGQLTYVHSCSKRLFLKRLGCGLAPSEGKEYFFRDNSGVMVDKGEVDSFGA